VVTINQQWLEENVNEKAGYSYGRHCMEYLGKSAGAFRVAQGIQKMLTLAGVLAAKIWSMPVRATQLCCHLGSTMSTLGVLRIPSAGKDAVDSVAALGDDKNKVPFPRKVEKAVGSVADAVAAYGFAHMFVTGSPALRVVAQATDLTSDLVDVKMSVADYYKASALEKEAEGDVKVAVAHTKTYQFFRVVKAVAAVAATIFGFVLLALGMPLVALLTVSLASTLFAILRDIYKDSGRFKVIDLDRAVTL
jgi:hypothetical protein